MTPENVEMINNTDFHNIPDGMHRRRPFRRCQPKRSFVTTVSIKTMTDELRKCCLSPEGWHLEGNGEAYDIRHPEDSDKGREDNYGKTFYKQKCIKATLCFGETGTSAKDISFPEDSIVDVSVILE